MAAVCPYRSKRNVDAAYVTFINRTSRDVDIVWHGFEANRVLYAHLKCNQFQDMNTYKDHPWTAIDSATGVNLLLNGQPVFFPVSVREIHERLRLVQVPLRSLSCRRSEVNVTNPMFSLSDLCRHILMRFIRSADDVQKLEIPKILEKELIALFLAKEECYKSILRATGVS